VGSDHAWALGRSPSAHVRQGHRTQIGTYAMSARAAHENLDVAINGGDYNEHVDGDSYVEQLMRGARMTRATEAHGLEALFVSRSVDVRVKLAETITLPTPGDDHPVRYVELKLRKLAAGATPQVR
jgi:hypothetical protein